MTDGERLLLGGGLSLWIGYGTLNIGLAILKNRPVVIPPKTMKAVLPLLLLPLFIMVTLWLAEESLAQDPDIPYLTLLACILLTTIAIGVLWGLFFPQVFALYNVTGEMVIGCLVEALQKRGMQVALQETTNSFDRVRMVSKTTVVLPEWDSSIKVTLSMLGTARLRIRGWRRISEVDAIIADFVNALAHHQCGDSWAIGIQLVLMGMGTIGIVLYTLFELSRIS